MKNILLITYFFPPRPPEFAGRHAAALARYLPEHGWDPVVLTAALPADPLTRHRTVQTPYRDSLGVFKRMLGIRSEERLMMYIAELKKKLRITSQRSVLDIALKMGGEILAYPDPQKGWRVPALTQGHALLEAEPMDAMVSISPPVTSHIVAAELKRRHGIPWVAYFLDLWTQNHYYPYSRFRRARERRLEVRTLSQADAVSSVSQPLVDRLGQLHAGKHSQVVRLGFDPDELADPSPPLSTMFTITYTGNIYPGRQSPEPLFRALAELISARTVDPNDLEVRFFGPEWGWIDKLADRFGLGAVVRQHGFVPRQRSVELQRESQLLLVLGWLHPGELGVYTAKVYEYLARLR
jgi:glycosyltransferase involved in cell wall biosynthesis